MNTPMKQNFYIFFQHLRQNGLLRTLKKSYAFILNSKEIAYYRLYEKISSSEKKYVLKHNPESILLELSQKCNLGCPMCGRHLSGQSNLEMQQEVLERAEPFLKTAKTVWLGGNVGEPLLHSKIIEIIRYICNLNKKCLVTLNSNGMLLSEKMSNDLIESGLSQIYISIDGKTKYGHVGGGQVIERIVKNLRYLNSLKASRGIKAPQIFFLFTIMRSNIHEVSDIIDIAKEMNVKGVIINPLIPYERELADDNIFRHRELVKNIFGEHMLKARKLGVQLSYQGMDFDLSAKRRICKSPFNTMFILYDGKVVMCCGDINAKGDMLKDRIEEIWNNEEYLNKRKGLITGNFQKPCDKCVIVQNSIDYYDSWITR